MITSSATTHLHFKQQKTAIERSKQSSSLRKSYPDRVPVIVDRHQSEKILPQLAKQKYLVPGNMTLGNFVSVIREKLPKFGQMSITIFCRNVQIGNMSTTLSEISQKMSDRDGFVYLEYMGESTFG